MFGDKFFIDDQYVSSASYAFVIDISVFVLLDSLPYFPVDGFICFVSLKESFRLDGFIFMESFKE